ncbi:TIGR03617 family F420-dependent LLM class oxidoreductase [Herbiconiux sp. P15]|uniref:TIGR03617 family F420-dependent LLM class oxidoreductase n=1 Tax=Herbiconiux liukaitaii TaxID=3342799 RepID=UPI0035BAC161
MPDEELPTSRPFLIDAGGDVASNPLESEAEAVRAEADGYDGVLAIELKHDPFVSLALSARATERVRLTSAIAVAFARNPMNTAMLANDIQLISGGRFVLGLGSQVKAHIERRFDMPWSHPARRMREYVQAVRAIQHAFETGERLKFEGEFYSHTLLPPMFSPGANPHGAPPIVVAGVGELMTEVVGEVAEGLLVHPLTTRRYLDEVTLPALAKGRATSGRSDAVELSLPAFVAIGESQESLDVAVRAVRKQIAFYGSTPSYRGVLEVNGWGELYEPLHAGSVRGDWEAMADLVPDSMLAEIAVVGSPAEVAAGLRARFGGVIQRISFNAPYPVDPSIWSELRRELA